MNSGNKNIRVLFAQGGAPHYFVKVLNRLNKELEVHVVMPANDFMTLGSGVKQSEDGIEYAAHRLPEKKSWYGKPMFAGFKKLVEEVNPDIIVIGWPYYLMFIFNWSLLFYLKKNKIKLLAKEIPFTIPGWKQSFSSFRDSAIESLKSDSKYRSRLVFYFHKFLWKILYKYIFNGALCYTDEGFAILGSYGMKSENIYTVLNSPDTDDLFAAIEEVKKAHPVRKKNRVLHVGRLVYWKRVDLLIEAINRLKNEIPDIELVIVGKGEEEENLKELTAKLGLKDRVKFMGSIYKETELCMQFQQADVYVLAGMGGLSINEAMCNGLPVICSVCDGTEKHLVFDNVNGYYFDADNLDSLTEKIRKVLADEEPKKKMGENSVQIIREKVNIHEVISRYANALRNFAN